MVSTTLRDPAPGGAGGTLTRLFWASYPGVPEAVTAARHHVARVLAGVPCAEDVAFALGEVAANAVVHSRSGRPGGRFTVATDVVPGVLAAVVVTDQGGPWSGRADDTYPHGLEIVAAMATEVRVDGDDDGRTIWVIFPWEVSE
jgi:anti-sigma regulatory factor (Ser/Thr protein kinase)